MGTYEQMEASGSRSGGCSRKARIIAITTAFVAVIATVLIVYFATKGGLGFDCNISNPAPKGYATTKAQLASVAHVVFPGSAALRLEAGGGGNLLYTGLPNKNASVELLLESKTAAEVAAVTYSKTLSTTETSVTNWKADGVSCWAGFVTATFRPSTPWPTVSLTTTSGDLSATALLYNSLTASTQSGQLSVVNTGAAGGSAPISNAATLQTQSGDLTFKMSNVRSFSATTESGNILIDGVSANWFTLGSESGGIQATIDVSSAPTKPRTLRVTTQSGNVHLTIKNGFKGTYQVTTQSGDVSVDGKADNSGTIGGGGDYSLIIQTESGDVTVTFIQAS